MSRGPAFGIALALFGTLVLTPDAMLMRLSGMDGFQMTGWRGLLMGSVMLGLWAATARDRAGDLASLRSGPGLLIVICQVFNSLLFCLGIASAPVAVVLMGVAAVPVCAALLARLVTGERASLATWAAIGAVLTGIAVAVLGDGAETLSLDLRALAGAAFGLGVALVLALNFVVLRARPRLPILLVIGLGALIAGGLGWAVTGPAAMFDGRLGFMALTGAVVLPVSFFTLSLASRHAPAATVSLIMLMETVLGPFWVWLGVGERPTPAMILGGAIVVISLALYLWRQLRRRAPFPAP
ncbi:DMT family transporter [Roseovarius aestuariivivens]|uniref:DMT family transporter n=1 Tax=Roseovarius aestuariivivens TaxID=1888910 RepID=UPI001081F9DF|nr:DMT family transporter [Roseovarius aestuariivivens]